MTTADGSPEVSKTPKRRALVAIGISGIVAAAWAGGWPTSASAAKTASKLLSRSPQLLAPSGVVKTYTVNSTTDAAGTCPGSPCTLRQAITNANSDGTLDLINFASAGTFVLGSTLSITDTGGVIIQGLGAGSTLLDGGGAVQVLSIAAGVAANISGITVQNGSFAGNGAGITNAGSLVLDRSVVRHNASTGTGNAGGGIFNGASLWLLNSTLGGATAADGNLADGGGGGLSSTGAVSLQNDTIQNNVADHTAAGSKSGGGVLNNGSVDADGVTFAGNSFGSGGGPVAGDQGGGLDTNDAARVQNSTFTSNSADKGGAVFNDFSAQFDNTTVSANSALTGGGGVYNQSNGDHTVLTNVTISGNSVTNSSSKGGGLFIESSGSVLMSGGQLANNTAMATSGLGGGAYGIGTMTLDGTSVTGNSAAAAGGGIRTGAASTLRNVTLSGNTAGTFAGGLDAEGTVTVVSSSISGNRANGGNGGGLYLNGNSTLSNLTVSGNNASANGGGIASVCGGCSGGWSSLIITKNNAVNGAGAYVLDNIVWNNAWVDSNTAGGNGGGILLSGNNGDARSITISGNTAVGNGGGLFTSASSMQLVNSTLSGNTAAAGDGIWAASGVTQLSFSTIAGNGSHPIDVEGATTVSSRATLVSGGSCVNNGGTLSSSGFNLEAPGDTCNFHGQSDQRVPDAKLGPLGSNGGFAPTVPLLGGSPAIDGAGTNCNVKTDERGISRPQLAGCDIGAYEFTSAGYWTVASDGGVFRFGGYGFYGSLGGTKLNAPVVGMAATPDRGGYFLGASDGGVFTFGNAVGHFHGSMGAVKLNSPVVGIAVMPDGDGYFLAAADGGVFTFGTAVPHFHGSMGATKLNSPVVGIAVMPDGDGYFLVAADGGIFTFGTAAPHFHGSMGAVKLNSPMVGIAITPDGDGYWTTAGDGGVFTFGTAVGRFFGSMGAIKLNQPVVGIAATSDGLGYFLVATDGGIFTFGDAQFFGSMGAIKLNQPMNGIAA